MVLHPREQQLGRLPSERIACGSKLSSLFFCCPSSVLNLSKAPYRRNIIFLFWADRRYGWRPLCAACALLLLLLSCSPCFFCRARLRTICALLYSCTRWQCAYRVAPRTRASLVSRHVLDGNAHMVSAPLTIHYLSYACLLFCRSCATHQPITPRCLHRSCCLRTIHAHSWRRGLSIRHHQS